MYCKFQWNYPHYAWESNKTVIAVTFAQEKQTQTLKIQMKQPYGRIPTECPPSLLNFMGKMLNSWHQVITS